MGLFKWFKSKDGEGEDGQSMDVPAPVPPSRVMKKVAPNTIRPVGEREGGMGGTGLGTLSFDAPLVRTVEEDYAAPPEAADKDIYLTISDFVDRIPPDYLGDYHAHLDRRIAFRLGDIFADLAKGRATVSLQTLYQFCPDIFRGPIADEEPVPISLPLHKLVEQVGTFENRPDQEIPEEFAPIDTPIARVAAEDGAKPLPVAVSKAKSTSDVQAPPDRSELAPRPVQPVQSPPLVPAPPVAVPSPATPTSAPRRALQPPVTVPIPAPLVRPAVASSSSPPPSTMLPAAPEPIPPPPTFTPIPPPSIAPIAFPAPPAPVAHAAQEPISKQPQQAGGVLRPSTQLPRPPIVPASAEPAAVGPPPVPAPPTPSAIAPISPGPGAGRRPPATVRASFAGGKITLRASVPPPPSAPGVAEPPQAPRPQALGKPLPGPASPPPVRTPQQKKITGRIQIPPLRLQADPGIKETIVADRSPSAAVPRPAAPVPSPPPPAAPPPILAGVGVSGSDSQEGQSGINPPQAPQPLAGPGVQSPMEKRISPPAGPQVSPAKPLAFSAPPKSQPTTNPSGVASEISTISLSIAAILRGVPAAMLQGNPPQLPEDSRVELPFSLIEHQLAEGRIAVPRQTLLDAAAPAHQHALELLNADMDVPLPLQEVFQNLPENSLSMRRDQVVEKLPEEYETPFLTKMREDEQRFAENDHRDETSNPEPSAPVAPPPPPVVAGPQPVSVAQALAADVPVGKAVGTSPAPLPHSNVNATKPAARPLFGKAEPLASKPRPAPLAVDATPQPVQKEDLSESVPLPVALKETLAMPARERAADPGSAARAPEPPPQKPVAPPRPETVRAHSPALGSQRISTSTGRTPSKARPAPQSAVTVSDAPTPPALRGSEAAPTGRPPVKDALARPETPAPAASPPMSGHKSEPAPPSQGAKPPAATPARSQPERPPAQPAAPIIPRQARHAPALHQTPVFAPPSLNPLEEEQFAIQSELQALFMTEEPLDAKNIVKHTSRLPGLSGCLLMFADGLPLAGNLPEPFSQDAFSAIVPRFMSRIEDYSRELQLGEVDTVTLHTDKGPVSLFMHGGVCMALLHSKTRFLPGVREKLAMVVREVSRLYSPETGGAPQVAR